MDSEKFLDFLKTEIENKMNLTKEKALREAKAIINEKKEVLDGERRIKGVENVKLISLLLAN